MADPGVSDLERERLLAEIGVEPSALALPVQAPSRPPPPPVASPSKPLPPKAASRPAPGGWRRRHVAAGLVMAAVGAAWTMVALGFGEPLAGGLAALALGGGAAALLKPEPLPKKP